MRPAQRLAQAGACGTRRGSSELQTAPGSTRWRCAARVAADGLSSRSARGARSGKDQPAAEVRRGWGVRAAGQWPKRAMAEVPAGRGAAPHRQASTSAGHWVALRAEPDDRPAGYRLGNDPRSALASHSIREGCRRWPSTRSTKERCLPARMPWPETRPGPASP